MRSGLIIHSAMTLTTLTCGQLLSFQKPVILILCLVFGHLPRLIYLSESESRPSSHEDSNIKDQSLQR